MQIKNIKIFDSTAGASGPWFDVSNLPSFSVQIVGLDAIPTWIEASNDPLVTIDNPTPLINAPSAPTLGQAPAAFGGLKGQGTYYVKATFTTPYGETIAGSESSLAVTDGNVLSVMAPVDATGIATGWNVYIGKSTGTEVLQSVPAYTPAWQVDLTPGIHWAVSGVLPLKTLFTLPNGWQNTGIAPPSSNTAGGPNLGVNVSGTFTSSSWTGPTGSFQETQVVLDTVNKQAMVNPSCLVWKWLRVVKSAGGSGTAETIAYLMGQNG